MQDIRIQKKEKRKKKKKGSREGILLFSSPESKALLKNNLKYSKLEKGQWRKEEKTGWLGSLITMLEI